MTTTTKAVHTPGALRAAEVLATEFKYDPQLRLRVLRAAEIIDRETAAAEMGAKLLELWNAGILADNDTHALLTKAGLI